MRGSLVPFCIIIILSFSTADSFLNSPSPILSSTTKSARSAPISRCCGVEFFSK